MGTRWRSLSIVTYHTSAARQTKKTAACRRSAVLWEKSMYGTHLQAQQNSIVFRPQRATAPINTMVESRADERL